MTALTGDEIRHNERMTLAFEGVTYVFFGSSVMALYYESQGLTPAQIYMLQSTLAIVIISLDVPCGRIADLIGVRKMVIFGASFTFLQSVYFSQCEEYWEFQIALVLTGIHAGCLKNTTDVLMTFTFRSIKDGEARTRAYDQYLAKKSWTTAGSYTAGVLLGGGLAHFGGLAWPYYLQPVVYAISVCIAWRLKQPQQTYVIESFRAIVVMMLIDRRSIRTLIMLTASVETFLLLCVWSIQFRLELTSLPRWMYAVVYALWGMGTWCCARWSHRARLYFGDNLLWLLVIVASAYGALMAGLLPGVMGVVVMLIGLTPAASLTATLTASFLARILPSASESRNTELAVASTASSLVFATLSPVFGELVVVYGVRASLAGLGVVGLGSGCAALWALNRAVRQD